jgi:hypothetical protein
MLGSAQGGDIMDKLRLVLALVVILAIGGFMAYETGPGLLRDWRLRSAQTVEVPSELTEGDCRVYVLAINFCDVKLTTDSATLDDTLLFFDFSTEGYDVVAIVNQNDPSQVTTSIGLNMFWNRVATLLGFLGLLVVGLIGSIGKLLSREPAPAT